MSGMSAAFQLIPAIDIKDGRCVRLKQGRLDETTVFAEDPLEAATYWSACGAKRLHLVDLDGAFASRPVNHKIVAKICHQLPHLEVQVGGGIRSMDTLNMLFDVGVSYCILGSSVVNDQHFVVQACKTFAAKIILGLDAKNGRLATEGWVKESSLSVMELAEHFADLPIQAIIYTDIARDGMLTGINLEATCHLAEQSPFQVIASGGAQSLADVKALYQTPQAKQHKITGLVAGRSLYTGDLDFVSANHWIQQQTADC